MEALSIQVKDEALGGCQDNGGFGPRPLQGSVESSYGLGKNQSSVFGHLEKGHPVEGGTGFILLVHLP